MAGRITALLLLSFLSSFGGVRADLKEYPENVAVKQGDAVILKCGANRPNPQSRIMWIEFASNTNGLILSDNRAIVPTHPNSARYSIVGNATENEFYLRIENVKAADAGKYSCQDILSGSPSVFRRYAEIVVLASQQVCKPLSSQVDPVEGKSYTTHCQVNYTSATIVPEMEWSGPVGTYQANQTVTNRSLSSYMTFTAHRSLEGRNFECKTYFRSGFPVEPSHADNVPDYVDTYNTPILFIYWKPTNISISPLLSEYTVGDEITCWADGNPDVEYYRWFRVDDIYEHVTSGNKFAMIQKMVGYNTTLRCEATNFIGGFPYHDKLTISAYVVERSSDSTITTRSASTGVTLPSSLLSNTPVATTSSVKATSLASIGTSTFETTNPTYTSASKSTSTASSSRSSQASDISSSTLLAVSSTQSTKPSTSPTTTLATSHWQSDRLPQHESVMFHSLSFVGGILLGAAACMMGLLGYKLLSAAKRRRAPPYDELCKDVRTAKAQL